jgi:hypothetical protein
MMAEVLADSTVVCLAVKLVIIMPELSAAEPLTWWLMKS